MKEIDFPTKNCRSAKKTTQLKTTIEKQRQRDDEMYIYHTKKYFVKLYKRYYMFNLLLMHFPFCLHQFYVKICY